MSLCEKRQLFKFSPKPEKRDSLTVSKTERAAYKKRKIKKMDALRTEGVSVYARDSETEL